MQIRTQAVLSSPQEVERALAAVSEQFPALAGLFESFGPLLAWRARQRLAAPGWVGEPPVVDPERFAQGACVLDDAQFQNMSADLSEAAAGLLPVMARSFAALAPQLAVLGQALDSGLLSPRALAEAGFGQPESLPGVDPAVLAFVAAWLVKPFVERQAKDLAELVRELPWSHATCPVCGDAPNMSVLRRMRDDSEYIQAHGGRRFLRCSSCSAEWTHKRVSCPACGCEEPDELAVLRDPARPYERVDACRRCNTFLLCLDAGELAEAPDADVTALAMSALEAKARLEGFAPLADHPWSGLLKGA